MIQEDVFRYGEGDRGFGMVTFPKDVAHAPVVVIFNAGLIHREGPYRLNVLVGRALAELGYIAIRVDLSGKGDTPVREGLKNRESVALDWQYIKQAILNRFGQRRLVLMGLCSGADNAIKITAEEPDVYGLVLMDAVSPRDAGFVKRDLLRRLKNFHQWINLPFALWRYFKRCLGGERSESDRIASLRDEPTDSDMHACFHKIVQRHGKVLAVFTSQASRNYNQRGQFARAINIPGLAPCCEEIYWPLVKHLYPLDVHRNRLIAEISRWAGDHLAYLRGEAER